MDARKPTAAPRYFLSLRRAADAVVWDVAWRHTAPDGTRRKLTRRLAPAWMQRAPDGLWVKRTGRPKGDALDARGADHAAAAFVAREEAKLRDAERREGRTAPTFREVAAAWLDWLATVKGAKPSTLRDHGYVLAEPGRPHKRGGGASAGLVMAGLGDVDAASVTTRQVEAVLASVAATGVSARTVNKTRNVLAAIFAYGCRASTFALPENPVREADRRREPPAATRDYYSVEQVEALARTLTAGLHRDPRSVGVEPHERAAANLENEQDAEAVRLSAFTGLRAGELRALRWRDVDFPGAKLTVRRTVSGGQLVDSTKSGRTREVPLADVALATLDRLSRRPDFTGPDDYVVCSRTGARVEESALRRRYRRAQLAAGVPVLPWHGLRHTFGSLLAAGGEDLVTVKAAMGHARITTTERYLHARPATAAAARFSMVFGATPAGSHGHGEHANRGRQARA